MTVRLLVWLVGGFVLGTTFMVALRHLALWQHNPRRLLPLHVWLIALSYDLLLVAVLTRPVDWRAWIYVPALCLGGVAMVVILRYQKQQVSSQGERQ